MQETKKKQSVIVGALTGSAGIFITKIISLLYVIPFNEIACEETTFYSYGYSVYNTLLDICLSGLPFAIATLISKYMALEDEDTVALVKKVSSTLIATIGVAFCAATIVFAGPITTVIIPEESTAEVFNKTRNVIMIISTALIFVPILAYYRGYYQGLKDMKVYAFTQVLEQLSRVLFLLAASSACVYLFHMDRIWAAYMAVAGASVGAIFAILYFRFYDSKNNPVQGDAKASSFTSKQILKELVLCAIPYLLSSLTGAGSSILILTIFPRGLTAYGMNATDIVLNEGLLNFQCQKLVGIPMIIMNAFCISLVPHVTDAITRKDNDEVKALISRIFVSTLYLSIPICLYMCFFAKEIYTVVYGDYQLEMGTAILRSYSIVVIFMNMMGILGTLLIAIGKKNTYTKLEVCRLIILCPLLYFCLKYVGIQGYFLGVSSEQLFFCTVCLFILSRDGLIKLKTLLKPLAVIILSCIPMVMFYAPMLVTGFDITPYGRIATLLFCGFSGLLTVGLYLLLSSWFKLPQQLFQIESFKSLFKRLLKK